MIHPYLRFFAIVAGIAFFAPVAVLAEEKAPPAIADDDPVVATVNGSDIFLSEVEGARSRLPPRFNELPEGAIFGLLVNSLIDTHLMSAEARHLNLHEEIKFKRQVKRIEDQLLERTLLSKRLEDNLSEDAIKKRYDKFVEEKSGRPEVHARHILVDNEDKAKEIIAKLNNGGDFAKLAKEHSTGPSAANGGDLGYFTKDQMVAEFSNVAFALANGEIAPEPVKTKFGWHVIKVEDQRPSVAPPFEKVKGKISSLLSNEIASAYIKELRNAAQIDIVQPTGSLQSGGAPMK